MPILSCLEEPPCTPVLLIECKRKSPPWPHPPLRSRLSLPLRESTRSGSEDPSWLHCPPSNRCGSPNRSMMSLDLPSFTGSASKSLLLFSFILQTPGLLSLSLFLSLSISLSLSLSLSICHLHLLSSLVSFLSLLVSQILVNNLCYTQHKSPTYTTLCFTCIDL